MTRRLGRALLAAAFLPSLFLASVAVARAADVSSLRVVSGTVLADGGEGQGDGFTSAKTSTGHYTVTFTTAFDAAPVVLLSLNTSSNPTTVFLIGTVAGSFDVGTVTPNVAFYDGAFSFVAIDAGDRTIVDTAGGGSEFDGEIVAFTGEAGTMVESVLFAIVLCGVLAVCLLAGILVVTGLRR